MGAQTGPPLVFPVGELSASCSCGGSTIDWRKRSSKNRARNHGRVHPASHNSIGIFSKELFTRFSAQVPLAQTRVPSEMETRYLDKLGAYTASTISRSGKQYISKDLNNYVLRQTFASTMLNAEGEVLTDVLAAALSKYLLDTRSNVSPKFVSHINFGTHSHVRPTSSLMQHSHTQHITLPFVDPATTAPRRFLEAHDWRERGCGPWLPNGRPNSVGC
jgi:hypothetical protein